MIDNQTSHKKKEGENKAPQPSSPDVVKKILDQQPLTSKKKKALKINSSGKSYLRYSKRDK